jgi:hypothetical protein
LFFGQKVERLSAYQYGLVSLIPELLRQIDDVGSPLLDNNLRNSQEKLDPELSESEKLSKLKLYKMGFPLRVFGKVKKNFSFFLKKIASILNY